VTSHGWSCLCNRGVVIDYMPAGIDRSVRRALFPAGVIDWPRQVPGARNFRSVTNRSEYRSTFGNWQVCRRSV